MSKFKHILFDCDGVLVDTEYTAAIKMVDVLRSYQKEVSIDYYLQNHSGTTFSAIMTYYFGNELDAESTLKIITKVEDQVSAEVGLITGMDKVLTQLKNPMSVVSNSSVRTVKHALLKTGLDTYFDGRVFSSEQVAHPKPAPDLYRFALSQLSLAPHLVLVVEDSLTGAKAALDAGLEVIGFAGASHILPGHKEKLSALGVADVVESPAELLEMLNSKFH